MNWMLLVAGFIAVFVNFGHLTIGNKMFLKPMLDADFDLVAKKTMHCVFHYVSVFLLLSAAVLILTGLNINLGDNVKLLIWFISANYFLFSVWQIIIAMTSGIPKVMTKLFQWVLFISIAVLSFFGACTV